MSIEQTPIRQEISHLFAYYQRPLSDYILEIWEQFLTAHLTTGEIHQAIAAAVTKLSELPTPEQLVELVKGTGYFCLLALNQSLAAKGE
ncbi:MAG: hypothetical protein SFT94_06225 [Pseudanabaenaceae cyanobacterium bins.68]|nr:hypothetical protein [Pseudanabaenaceae cyanobacterium bins.68]